jgi:hypothetical protein
LFKSVLTFANTLRSEWTPWILTPAMLKEWSVIIYYYRDDTHNIDRFRDKLVFPLRNFNIIFFS